MVFAIFGVYMNDVRYNAKLNYIVEAPGFVSVVRNENFVLTYKEGKNDFSFVFVQRGELEYLFTPTGKTIQIKKDDVLFIPKNYPYKVTYKKENTKIQILRFEVKNESFLNKYIQPICVKSSDVPLIFGTISFQNMLNPLFLSAKIYELLYHTENQIDVTPKKYKQLLPAIKELSSLYFKNEKISYYAKLCDMGESNFRKLFKEYTGKSPIEYRNLIRISNVKRFLNSGEFTIREAADLAGFNNMAFFYEIYNRYTRP